MRVAAWAAGAGLAAALLGLLLVGWRPVVLLSDSMAPGAPAGSLLLARPVDATAVEVGDVVTVPTGDTGQITHRVIALEELDGATWARLRGDANETPDPTRVELQQPTLRTEVVVPMLGRLLTLTSPLMLAGLGLLVIGTGGLALVGRRDESPVESTSADPAASLPTGRNGIDTRVIALAATLEAFAEDGMDAATLEALARARTGALLGLGAVEDAEPARALDDGARFVLLSLADADAQALGVIPSGARRAIAARAAVTQWWEDDVAGRVPAAARSELAGVLADATRQRADATRQGGILRAGPVD